MESVACNLCGSDAGRPVYRQPDALFAPDEWFTVVECPACGLGYVNPRPTRDEIGRYYPRPFFDHFDERAIHVPRYAVEAGYLPVVEPGREMRLLDVGCANGDFPRFMRDRGWAVEGVEIGEAARPIADFPVHRVEFSQIPADGPRYDAVTAWAVIEHVHDPKAYFRKAAEVLKPGGTFAFLVTNFASLSSRALFREDVPRHLYFFTLGTVRRYLAEAGLHLERAIPDRDVFRMLPSNCIYFALHRYVLRRPLTWFDLPESREQFARRKGLAGPGYIARAGLLLNLRYALSHPLAAVDRIAAQIYERWQIRNGTYGIVTYVARKPDAQATPAGRT